MIAKNLVNAAPVPVATLQVTQDELDLITTLLYHTGNTLNDANPSLMYNALLSAGGEVTGTVRPAGTSVYVEKR